MILVIGAKGGVGTTFIAQCVVRAIRGVGLDAADGSLAARLDRPALDLSHVALLPRAALIDTIDHVVRRRTTLLWTPACSFLAAQVLGLVRAVDERAEVVADGGIEPPPELASVNGRVRVVIVSATDNPVATWHERRLLHQFPGAYVIHSASREQVNELLHNLV